MDSVVQSSVIYSSVGEGNRVEWSDVHSGVKLYSEVVCRIVDHSIVEWHVVQWSGVSYSTVEGHTVA